MAMLLACLGATIGWLAGFPAPFLTGSALCVTLASVLGVRGDIDRRLRNAAFLLIGIAMGATVTPDVYATARQWPWSFAVLALLLLLILWWCPILLRRFWHLDRTTAFLSTSPGHLSFVLGLSLHTRADIPTVSVIQSIRVLSLTLLVPVIVTLLGYQPVSMPGAESAMPLWQLLLLFIITLALAWWAERRGMPAAYLLCGMAISGMLQVTGVLEGGLHPNLAVPAIVLMGAVLGTRFSGVERTTLRKALTAGLGATMLILALTGLAAVAFSHVSGLPVAQLLVAFSPGGVEAMATLALMLDVDPAFVAAHHAWRLVVLSMLLPAMMQRSPNRHSG